MSKSFAEIFMRAYARSSASPHNAMAVLRLAEFADWWQEYSDVRGAPRCEPPPRLGNAQRFRGSTVPLEVIDRMNLNRT